jgi:hypothetical protein
MKKPKPTSSTDRGKVRPGGQHWWWRKNRLKRALKENRRLDQLFFWKVKGRKSPDGAKWTAEQRRSIETALWLYELDARISHKYLFGRPAHLLTARQLASVVSFASLDPAQAPALKPGGRRRKFAWAWIEYFDKRGDQKAPKLTRAELNGIIAAMKFCLECFVHA